MFYELQHSDLMVIDGGGWLGVIGGGLVVIGSLVAGGPAAPLGVISGAAMIIDAWP